LLRKGTEYDLRLEERADEKRDYAALSDGERSDATEQSGFIKLVVVLGHQPNFRTFRKKTVLSFIESV